jgi:glucose-fructose oxidoreductase
MAWGGRSQHDERRIRYAVVGLGWSTQASVLPSFKSARDSSELVALVSDESDTISALARKLGVETACGYDAYDDLLASGTVDAVCIALPKGRHRDFAERAARRGVHVLCEPPMAATETDSAAMIRVCEDHHVKLMIGYRLHFDACHLEAIEIVQSGRIGEPRMVHVAYTRRASLESSTTPTRYGEEASLGDMAIACINAVRYLFQDEPTEVSALVAHGCEPALDDAPELTSAVLRFPGEKLATFACSYAASPGSSIDVVGTGGRLRIDPAFELDVALKRELTVDAKTTVRKFPKRESNGPDVAYFSECIVRDLIPESSGWEGLADVRILEAIHRAVATRQTVKIAPIPRRRRPSSSHVRVARPARGSPYADAATR